MKCWTSELLFPAAVLMLVVPLRADEPRPERITPIVRVFKEASPAVVNLSTTSVVTLRQPRGFGGIFDDIFDFPIGQPRSYTAHSVGSGFLIHADGYLVTNAHVIDRAAECKVIFADGTELPAEEVASDRKNDLAVLKVPAKMPLPYLPLGHSSDLMPGETVIAIGNPLGYGHTVTTGIVSALNRELRFSNDRVYSGLIQTDASINPGNSGGPLLNILGELIGINTAIRGDAQNIGFAIPVDRLHDLLPFMLDIQRIQRVNFGLHFINGEKSSNPPGIRVRRVDPGSPAAEAGIHRGDIVTAIEKTPTPDFLRAFGVLQKAKPGGKLRIDLVTENGKKRAVDVSFTAIPKLDADKLMLARFGLEVREMTAPDLAQLGVRRSVGLYVSRVKRGSQAAEEGIAAGDIVTSLGGWPVTSLAALGQLLEQINAGDEIQFQFLRIANGSATRLEGALRAQ